MFEFAWIGGSYHSHKQNKAWNLIFAYSRFHGFCKTFLVRINNNAHADMYGYTEERCIGYTPMSIYCFLVLDEKICRILESQNKR